MSAPQGYCTYPGVNSVLRARYALGHGITPGVIELEIAPQSGPVAAIGNVVFYYGNTTLTLLNCRADQASTVRGSDGTITSVAILDRRWAWKYLECYGHYNQRDQDGRIIPATERTPQELAQILLSYMGESCDVSALPNSARDEVEWVGDNPAEELADLCERLGCSIVLRPDQSIAIVQMGAGFGLPIDEFLTQAQVDTNPPEMPATIKIVGAPYRFQARLQLEAVGYEVDGTLKSIDNLSYKPQVSAGWGREYDYFSGVTDESARVLAIRDVFKLYRIRDMSSASPSSVVSPPGVGPVSYLRQILPLHRGLVETGPWMDSVRRRKPERVMGIYFVRNVGIPTNSTTSQNYEYKGDFQIDYERGLVRFPETMVKWDSNSKLWLQADIKLECSFSAENANTGDIWRYGFTYPTGSPTGYGVDVVRREELMAESYEFYSSNTASPIWRDKVTGGTLDDAASVFAQGRLRSYTQLDGASGLYAGLRQFSPDGAIMQVEWSVGDQGTFTSVSRLSESHPRLLSRKQMRAIELQRKQRRQSRGNTRGRK